MRSEGDFIRLNEWLAPLSWLYGIAVRFRNQLFDMGVLKSHSFDLPVISVGNITVGGSGKTPHVEYLVRLLKDKAKVAVLSRGYKRKSKGYVLAGKDSTTAQIGDEPYQMKCKFSDIYIAVDKKRKEGIERLMNDPETRDVEVIVLDDAFQHRYVKPGLNILLVDYHRLLIYDKLLPVGRLREPKEGKNRADMVIVTKCPADLKPMEFRVLTRAMELYPFQSLYFTTLKYGRLKQMFGNRTMELKELSRKNVLLLTGIASPDQMMLDLRPYNKDIRHMEYGDHHQFTEQDVHDVEQAFNELEPPRIIITTEKDKTRLEHMRQLMGKEVCDSLYVLPVEIRFMLGKENEFNNKIIDYVRKNSRNSRLAQGKNDDKPHDGHHSGNRPGTISFRNN